MSFTKINVDKLIQKLSGVSVEQRQEIHEKLGTQLSTAKEDYIKKMEARIAALKSGKSLVDLEKEEQAASGPVPEKKVYPRKKKETAAPAETAATL